MLKFFKILALLEGSSLLLLVLFAMPMKYLFQEPLFVKIIGMAHGCLFVAYIIMVVVLQIKYKWHLKKCAIVCLASVVPFGTFYVERNYLN